MHKIWGSLLLKNIFILKKSHSFNSFFIFDVHVQLILDANENKNKFLKSFGCACVYVKIKAIYFNFVYCLVAFALFKKFEIKNLILIICLNFPSAMFILLNIKPRRHERNIHTSHCIGCVTENHRLFKQKKILIEN